MKLNKYMYGLLLIICCGLLVLTNQEKEDFVQVIQEKGEEKQVFLLHENELLMVNYESFMDTKEKQIGEAIQFMKQSFLPFNNLLAEESEVNEIIIKDGLCIVDFNVLEYEIVNEVKLLEALIFTLTKDESIDHIELKVMGETLTHMPKNNTEITYSNMDYGINHLQTNDQYLHDYDSVFLYEYTKVDEFDYLRIQSMCVENSADYDAYINLMCENINYLKKEKIRTTETSVYKDGTLLLNINKHALNKDGEVKKDFIELLILNFEQYGEINNLQIVVDGQLISIDGKNKLKINEKE